MAHFAGHFNMIYLSPKAVTMNILTVFILLSLVKVIARRNLEPRAHAPCYDCEFHHIMQRDQGFHDNQVSFTI